MQQKAMADDILGYSYVQYLLQISYMVLNNEAHVNIMLFKIT
jgi:hypothetical protein